MLEFIELFKGNLSEIITCFVGGMLAVIYWKKAPTETRKQKLERELDNLHGKTIKAQDKYKKALEKEAEKENEVKK